MSRSCRNAALAGHACAAPRLLAGAALRWPACLALRCLAGTALALVALIAASQTPAAGKFGLGKPATNEEIAGWDIDVKPDGTGLPRGRGSVADGQTIYDAKCASCH